MFGVRTAAVAAKRKAWYPGRRRLAEVVRVAAVTRATAALGRFVVRGLRETELRDAVAFVGIACLASGAYDIYPALGKLVTGALLLYLALGPTRSAREKR